MWEDDRPQPPRPTPRHVRIHPAGPIADLRHRGVGRTPHPTPSSTGRMQGRRGPVESEPRVCALGRRGAIVERRSQGRRSGGRCELGPALCISEEDRITLVRAPGPFMTGWNVFPCGRQFGTELCDSYRECVFLSQRRAP